MPLPKLSQALREEHEATMICQAETIQQWGVRRERHEEAMMHVRLALFEQGTGRISDATRYRVYSILNFVLPDDAAFDSETTPLPELEREAASEAAYYEQLERQSCPDAATAFAPSKVAHTTRHNENNLSRRARRRDRCH